MWSNCFENNEFNSYNYKCTCTLCKVIPQNSKALEYKLQITKLCHNYHAIIIRKKSSVEGGSVCSTCVIFIEQTLEIIHKININCKIVNRGWIDCQPQFKFNIKIMIKRCDHN